jgi:hypothetical protein
MSATDHQVLSFSVMREIATGTLVATKSRTAPGENSEAKDVEDVENLVMRAWLRERAATNGRGSLHSLFANHWRAQSTSSILVCIIDNFLVVINRNATHARFVKRVLLLHLRQGPITSTKKFVATTVSHLGSGSPIHTY